MKAFSDAHKDASYAATEPVAYYLLSDMGFTDNTPEGYLQSQAQALNQPLTIFRNSRNCWKNIRSTCLSTTRNPQATPRTH